MAALQHVYLTAHGEWTSATWQGEQGQIGLRVAFSTADPEPAKGSIFTPLGNGDVDTDGGTSAGTNGTLTRTWKARVGPIGSTTNMDDANQIDMAEDFRTYLSGLLSAQDADWRWTHVKLAPILADGKYGAPAATYQFTTPLVGSASASLNCAPPELSVAVSLRAPIIGRRGRGRVYIPGLSTAAIGANGTYNTGYNPGLLTGMQTLIGDLEDFPGVEDFTPIVCVMSAGSATAVRPTEVRVGNHLDVQRRRQHQVRETYTSLAL